MDGPLADAVQRTFPASIVWNREEPPQHHKNLSVKFSARRFLWTPVDGQNIPPHVAGAVERIRPMLVKVGKVRRTPGGHDLLEKWHEGTQGA